MAALGRAAFRASRVLRESGINSGAPNRSEAEQIKKGVLQKGARRDPELYVRVSFPQYLERWSWSNCHSLQRRRSLAVSSMNGLPSMQLSN